MSIWAVNWALHTEIQNSTHKLILIALANFADEENQAWPHVETLAKLASCTERTVQRALEALELDGLIERTMGLGPSPKGGMVRTNSIYRVLAPDHVSRAAGKPARRPNIVRPSITETPSGHRCDTSVVTVNGADETPSGDRCDTGVVTVDRCDTGDAHRCDTGDAPYKEEPSTGNHQTPLPPATHGAETDAGQVGSGDDVDDLPGPAGESPVADDPGSPVDGVSASGGPGRRKLTLPEIGDAYRVVRECLPEAMQALDTDTANRVADLLRERIAAGWQPSRIREVLEGNPLPPKVEHLGGLVVYRVRLIPVDAPLSAPSPVTTARTFVPEPKPQYWLNAQVAKARARMSGAPEAAHPLTWFITKHPGTSDVPRSVDLATHLQQELAS